MKLNLGRRGSLATAPLLQFVGRDSGCPIQARLVDRGRFGQPLAKGDESVSDGPSERVAVSDHDTGGFRRSGHTSVVSGYLESPDPIVVVASVIQRVHVVLLSHASADLSCGRM